MYVITWRNVLEEIIVKCIRNGDFVEDYDKENDKNFFMLTEEAQKYLCEVRKRYITLNEAVNAMKPKDFEEADDE